MIMMESENFIMWKVIKISFQETFKSKLTIKQIHEQETTKQNKEREAAITDLMKHLNGDKASIEIIYDVI